MARPYRLLGISAFVSLTGSVCLLRLSFAMHSFWPIIPGVYVLAYFVGVHSASMTAVAAVNGILLSFLTAGLLSLWWRRPSR